MNILDQRNENFARFAIVDRIIQGQKKKKKKTNAKN